VPCHNSGFIGDGQFQQFDFYLSACSVHQSEVEHDIKIAQQRTKQLELIGQLKSQLEDLETYAYEVR
jgi:hypothetical protein